MTDYHNASPGERENKSISALLLVGLGQTYELDPDNSAIRMPFEDAAQW